MLFLYPLCNFWKDSDEPYKTATLIDQKQSISFHFMWLGEMNYKIT